MLRSRRLVLAVLAALAAFAAVPAGASAAGAKAAAVSLNCGLIGVPFADDADVGFPRGTYDVATFAPTPRSLHSCIEAESVLQSYLYDPETHDFWNVRPLRGRLAGKVGRRFSLETDPRVGFNVWRVSRRVAFTGAAASPAAAPATTAADATTAAGPDAWTAATQQCFVFQVVHNNSDIGFPSGYYQRLNFFQRRGQLNCNPPQPDSFDLLRDYLYDGRIRGWAVGKLIGSVARYNGCRFVKNGSGGRVGFDVYCDGRNGSKGSCVRARLVNDNCGIGR